MKILDQLRNRSPQGSGDAEPTEGASADEAQLPISGYDGLKSKQITEQLSQLSQVELADVETYERAHEDRPACSTSCATCEAANRYQATTPSAPTRSPKP